MKRIVRPARRIIVKVEFCCEDMNEAVVLRGIVNAPEQHKALLRWSHGSVGISYCPWCGSEIEDVEEADYERLKAEGEAAVKQFDGLTKGPTEKVKYDLVAPLFDPEILKVAVEKERAKFVDPLSVACPVCFAPPKHECSPQNGPMIDHRSGLMIHDERDLRAQSLTSASPSGSASPSESE